MRQALYGKRFFRQEFGKVSDDVYLPDCFGFGFALPSIAAPLRPDGVLDAEADVGLVRADPVSHRPVEGRGRQRGGRALNPGDYVTQIRSRRLHRSRSGTTTSRRSATAARSASGCFGTGDVGGAPDAAVRRVAREGDGQRDAARSTCAAPRADQLARDLTPAQKAALPVYEGELTMKTHGVGCYTSQAAMKKFNRTNELLADAAERASVAAEWLAGAAPIPRDRLREAWTRVLWHQFHDDLTGTCIPQAYQFSWNDELIVAEPVRRRADERDGGRVAARSTRSGAGVPLVVYNPLSTARRDPVEAHGASSRTPRQRACASSIASTGREVPAQVLSAQGSERADPVPRRHAVGGLQGVRRSARDAAPASAASGT